MVLPADKQARLEGPFETVAAKVEGRPAGLVRASDADYQDYGWQAARPHIEQGGVDRLIQTARAKSDTLRYGRAEALFAAGIRAAGFKQTDAAARSLSTDPAAARTLNTELLSLARTAGEFEQGDLAHAAASLAAHRCDLTSFDAAMGMVMARDAIRYKFWRARITRDRSGLPQAIMLGANSDDTSHARQTLEGLTLLAELGDCRA